MLNYLTYVLRIPVPIKHLAICINAKARTSPADVIAPCQGCQLSDCNIKLPISRVNSGELTTQSGSSGTTSQNDKGPAGCEARDGRASCARAAPLLPGTPSPAAARFGRTRWLEIRAFRYRWSSVWLSLRNPSWEDWSNEKTTWFGRSRSGGLRPLFGARVDGRRLALYSVYVRYCTSPGLSKRARSSKTATQHPRRAVPLAGRRSFTAAATLRPWFGVNVVSHPIKLHQSRPACGHCDARLETR